MSSKVSPAASRMRNARTMMRSFRLFSVFIILASNQIGHHEYKVIVCSFKRGEPFFRLGFSSFVFWEGGEYSRAGEWEADMRGNYGRTENYNRGNSYANRGRHYVRGHYSRGDGRERMISDIENMMQDATGTERDAYKRAADILRNA
jgi:hypothetical protein